MAHLLQFFRPPTCGVRLETESVRVGTTETQLMVPIHSVRKLEKMETFWQNVEEEPPKGAQVSAHLAWLTESKESGSPDGLPSPHDVSESKIRTYGLREDVSWLVNLFSYMKIISQGYKKMQKYLWALCISHIIYQRQMGYYSCDANIMFAVGIFSLLNIYILLDGFS